LNAQACGLPAGIDGDVHITFIFLKSFWFHVDTFHTQQEKKGISSINNRMP